MRTLELESFLDAIWMQKYRDYRVVDTELQLVRCFAQVVGVVW